MRYCKNVTKRLQKRYYQRYRACMTARKHGIYIYIFFFLDFTIFYSQYTKLKIFAMKRVYLSDEKKKF